MSALSNTATTAGTFTFSQAGLMGGPAIRQYDCQHHQQFLDGSRPSPTGVFDHRQPDRSVQARLVEAVDELVSFTQYVTKLARQDIDYVVTSFVRCAGGPVML